MPEAASAPRITGGPTRSASARLAHASVRAIIDADLGLQPDQAEELALRIAARLGESDIAEHLVERLNMAYLEAMSAWNLRDDLFEYPGFPETALR